MTTITVALSVYVFVNLDATPPEVITDGGNVIVMLLCSLLLGCQVVNQTGRRQTGNGFDW